MAYQVPDYVHARTAHDEIVILDARSNQYLGLNETGAVVWSVVAGGGSAADAVEDLLARFEVAREAAEADVAALLDRLLDLGLLVPAAP